LALHARIASKEIEINRIDKALFNMAVRYMGEKASID
jgi:hypothetical protein